MLVPCRAVRYSIRRQPAPCRPGPCERILPAPGRLQPPSPLCEVRGFHPAPYRGQQWPCRLRVMCSHYGNPRPRVKAVDPSLQRDKTSKRVGCPFSLTIWKTSSRTGSPSCRAAVDGSVAWVVTQVRGLGARPVPSARWRLPRPPPSPPGLDSGSGTPSGCQVQNQALLREWEVHLQADGATAGRRLPGPHHRREAGPELHVQSSALPGQPTAVLVSVVACWSACSRNSTQKILICPSPNFWMMTTVSRGCCG